MANTKTKKVETKTPIKKESKVMAKKETVKKTNKKAEISVIVPDDIKPMEVVEEKKAVVKKNKEKKTVTINQMTNSEMKELFISNGCQTYTKANDTSKVVYNTFGTKSRVLQQGRGYQLLLTNGHKLVKDEIVATDNDDTLRFLQWYGDLSDDKKAFVSGADTIMATKLSQSEMPRERVAKITNLDVLVDFIKYMATFAENKVLG